MRAVTRGLLTIPWYSGLRSVLRQTQEARSTLREREAKEEEKYRIAVVTCGGINRYQAVIAVIDLSSQYQAWKSVILL